MLKRIALLALSLIAALLPLAPQPALAQTSPAPVSALAAIVFPGVKTPPSAFGVYLGNGLVLTNWHPWTLDGREYTAGQPALSPSRQSPGYDADGQTDPGEGVLSLADCAGTWTHVDQADATCTPFAWFTGAGFTFPGADGDSGHPVPIKGLIYSSRAYDVAIFEVDPAAVEARGVQAARLSLVPTRANYAALAVAPTANQAAAITPVMIATGTPALLPQAAYALAGPWRVPSLVADQPDLPEGSPIFDAESGDLIGLVWRGSGSKTQPESWISPAAAWGSDLFGAAAEIAHPGLTAALRAARLAPVDALPTLDDPLAPGLGNAGIDVQHYTLNLAFDMEHNAISGFAVLTIRAAAPQLATFSLDAYGLDVSQVKIDGGDAPFVVKEQKLIIQLPAPVHYGAVFEVKIDYSAQPQPLTSRYVPYFQIGMFFSEGRVSTLNEPDGARTWFPCNDHPGDRAAYTMRLRVPEPLTAVGNGVLVSTANDGHGTRLFVWEMPEPMATYLVTLAVADYTALEESSPAGIPITNYVYTDRVEAGRAVFSYTGTALAMLQDLFGPYPFESYGHVVVPSVGMALETQTMTTMPDTALDGTEEDLYTLMVHELAHQWYGNTVTLKWWIDIWLNEGFATYAEWLGRELRYGPESALAARDYSERQLIADQRTTPLAAPDPGEMFGTASYDKGAWVLHMLREQIGDETFFALLKTYAETFRDRPVTTVDFWRLAEEVSGQDLAWFFEQWVMQGGIPRSTLYWTTGAAGVDVLLCADQPAPYRLDLPLRFKATDLTFSDITLAVSGSETRASFPLSYVPGEVSADPDQAVLAQVQVQPIAELPAACPAGSTPK